MCGEGVGQKKKTLFNVFFVKFPRQDSHAAIMAEGRQLDFSLMQINDLSYSLI